MLQVHALAQTLNDMTINLAFTSLLLRIFINNELHQLALMSSCTPLMHKISTREVVWHYIASPLDNNLSS